MKRWFNLYKLLIYIKLYTLSDFQYSVNIKASIEQDFIHRGMIEINSLEYDFKVLLIKKKGLQKNTNLPRSSEPNPFITKLPTGV